MQESYFFRNLNNYQELVEKTKRALQRSSKNKRPTYIICQIELSYEEFTVIALNFKKSCDIMVQYRNAMKIKDGIWRCIELKTSGRSILVMADGYPYPKFVALN